MLETITAANHAIAYKNTYNSKTSKRHHYVVGYEWTSGSWKPVTQQFGRHLQHMIYDRQTDPLKDYGVKGFMDFDNNAGTAQAVQFLVNYLQVPQYPQHIDFDVTAHQNAQFHDRWRVKLTQSRRQGGTYNDSATDKITKNHEQVELVVSFDGTTEDHYITYDKLLSFEDIVVSDIASADSYSTIFVKLEGSWRDWHSKQGDIICPV